jgi:hypothetical protein
MKCFRERLVQLLYRALLTRVSTEVKTKRTQGWPRQNPVGVFIWISRIQLEVLKRRRSAPEELLDATAPFEFEAFQRPKLAESERLVFEVPVVSNVGHRDA